MLSKLSLFLVLVTTLQGESKVEELCKLSGAVRYSDCRAEGKDKQTCKLEAEVEHHTCFLKKMELQQKIQSIKAKEKGSFSGRLVQRLSTLAAMAL